jgi:triosephosphate isomerase
MVATNVQRSCDNYLANVFIARVQVLKDGMKAVLCIGETQAQYQAGLNQEVSLFCVAECKVLAALQ